MAHMRSRVQLIATGLASLAGVAGGVGGNAFAQGLFIPPTTETTNTTQQVQPAQNSTGRAGWVPSPVEMIRREASKLQSLAVSEDVKRFLMATTWLPDPGEPITVYEKPANPNDPTSRRVYLTETDWNDLAPAEKAEFQAKAYDGYFFYTTRYGSPLAYLRPIEVLCAQIQREKPELRNALREKKILDFGFGGYGQLHLLASIGCYVTGVEVDPLLKILYERPDRPELSGVIEPSGMDDRKPGPGSLTFAWGQWPADAKTVEQVGTGYDIFISKNTLKRGYVVPERETDPRRLVQLGVERQQFVNEVARILNPGGYMLIYNICPKPSTPDEPYKPWGDGRSPFDREMFEVAGFEVIAFDQDDRAEMRKVAEGLAWNAGNNPMDLDNDFFVLYTLVRKK